MTEHAGSYDRAVDLPRDADGRVVGYSFTGTRQRGMYDWAERREDKAFERLVWRLQAKRYWANLSPEKRAQIVAYRRQWAKQHPERMREMVRKSKAKRRKNGKEAVSRVAWAAKRREDRAAEKRIAVASIIYTCRTCEAQWSPNPAFRIPCRPPEFCSQRCKSRASHERSLARHPRSADRVVLGYGGRTQAVAGMVGEITPERVMRALGSSMHYARSTLAELVRRGHVVRVRRGVYRAGVLHG